MSEKACTFFQRCKEKWRFFHRYANRIMIGDFDFVPLKLNLDFLNGIEVNSNIEEPEASPESNDASNRLPDYNYLME